MELDRHRLSTLTFPTQEWQNLRGAQTLASQPDEFLWGARVDRKILAWHPRGGAVEGANEATVLILEAKDELNAFGLYLKTVAAVGPWRDVEWVAFLRVLRERFHYDILKQGLPPFWAEALNLCGLEGHLGALAQRQKYFFLNERELKFLYIQNWDPAVFELLETLGAQQRAEFINAIEKYRLSASHSREASNHLVFLIKKFGEAAALNVLKTGFKNPEEFRLALLRTAQPELATLSEGRIRALRALKLPPRTSVFGDPSFEQDGLKITHTPRNFNDFEEFKLWVEKPENLVKMKELLEIYQ